MRALNTTQWAGVLLGAFMIIGGGIAVVDPVAANVVHPSDTGYAPAPTVTHEWVSKKKARVYGCGAVALGAGLLWCALARPKK